MAARDDARLVIYKLQICTVQMVYSHHLEVVAPDGTILRALFGDPELDRSPSEQDLAALRRPRRTRG
jgi:hypothetical protein